MKVYCYSFFIIWKHHIEKKRTLILKMADWINEWMNAIRSGDKESRGEGGCVVDVGTGRGKVEDPRQTSIAEDGGHVRTFGTQLWCFRIAAARHLLAQERTTDARGQFHISIYFIRTRSSIRLNKGSQGSKIDHTTTDRFLYHLSDILGWLFSTRFSIEWFRIS